MSKIAITLGDPCSIGSEIVEKALLELLSEKKINLDDVILVGCQKMFGTSLKNVDFIDIPADGKLVLGTPSRASGDIAFRSVVRAIDLAKSGMVRSIVTAPISKMAINLAGHKFSGHTEILDAYLDGTAQMLFVTGDFRVLLLTRHVPVAKVPDLLKKEFIETEILNLNKSLQKIGVKSPHIALCGLNPHAGEDGLLGREEIEEFLPAISSLQAQGVAAEGCFAADMLFAKAATAYRKGEKQPYDCYVATYHDQGLCAVKTLDLAKTVNVTIGLEVLRTSPAHGTAFDIAGRGVASAESMKQAILLAL